MVRISRTGAARLGGAVLALSLGLGAPPASAYHYRHAARVASKPAPVAAPTATDPAKPQLVGSFGDWGAYATGGKAKICYALAKPKDRSPSSLKKDQAYVFISNRPAEGVKNEISLIMGVPLKEGDQDAKAEVGATTFDLVAKGQNAWIKNAADETRFIAALRKGSKLVVKGPLVKGGTAVDSYSLAGLPQALDRVVKDCR